VVEIAATLEELVELVGLVEPAVSVGLAESAELVGSVERAELVGLVAGIAHPHCLREAAGAVTGNTIQHTAVEPLIETGRLRTDLEVARAATPSPTARQTPANKLDDREAICRATAAEEPVPATGPAAVAMVAEVAPEAERIASAVGICRAVGAKTVTPSEAVPAATTDRALVLTAVAERPAWDLEVEAGVGVVEVEAAVGAGRQNQLTSGHLQGAQNEISTCE
jgi:hypothetical protein